MRGLTMVRRLEDRCQRSKATISLARVTRSSEPIRDSRSLFPSARISYAISGRSRRPLLSQRNPRKSSPENAARNPSLAVVVTERVLVQVGLQVLGRYGVVVPADPAFHGRPES